MENGRTWLQWPGPCSVNGTPTNFGTAATITGEPFPEQEPLYEWRHYRTSAGTFGLDCNVPNGVYSLLFKWANASVTNHKTKFDVALEGATVAAGLEINVVAVGGNFALQRQNERCSYGGS